MTAVITLTTKEDTMDNSANFAVEFKGFRGRTVRTEAYVFDARTCRQDPGVFVMQRSAVLRGYYSPEQIAHQDRINTMTALKHGDVVEFDGSLWTVKILGDYSDMGRLIPVTAA